MDWNDVRYFLALSRLGSIRAAGSSLGVSHSTVSRRVEALEERLSARLFDRSRDGYTLTQAGRQMLPGAERVESEMSALERGVLGQDERLKGSIAITCCDNYVSELLLAELKDFCCTYPEIELDFNTDSRPFDLSRREADVAIRTLALDAQPPEYLIGQRVAPVTVANYVATAHAERLDPVCISEQTRWLSFEQREIHNQMIASSSYPDVPAWGSFSSLELMVQSTREGLGLCMLPTYVGDRDPQLQRLPKADVRHVANLWLLSHPDLRDNARFRSVRRLISDTLKAHADLFAGE